MQKSNNLKYFDIAANLADHQFYGKYHGKKYHEPDHHKVIERAQQNGVDKFLFASGHYEDVILSYELCNKFQGGFTTVGIHPCRANEIVGKEEQYFSEMEKLFTDFKDKIVAVGECGLDYDRFEYSSKEQQMKAFPIHFEWASQFKLPMYLHSRNCEEDFVEIISKNRDKFSTGVVHSYTGTLSELKKLLDLDLYIGVNGCSLKTEENLEIVKHIPLDKIMLETDSPYCDIRNAHASKKILGDRLFKEKDKKKYDEEFLVKGRNEPCKIVEVSKVVAKLLDVSEQELSQHAYENSLKLFKITNQFLLFIL